MPVPLSLAAGWVLIDLVRVTDMETTLSFRNVSLLAGDEYDADLRAVNFDVAPGECVLVHVNESQPVLPLADAAEGLVTPEEGSVAYQSLDWQASPPDERDGPARNHRARL